jgi:FKBP-type peptidyl-prolyl cis-trans isomerase
MAGVEENDNAGVEADHASLDTQDELVDNNHVEKDDVDVEDENNDQNTHESQNEEAKSNDIEINGKNGDGETDIARNSTTGKTNGDIVVSTDESETDKDTENTQEKLDIKDDAIVESEGQAREESAENEAVVCGGGDKGVENGLENEEEEEKNEWKEDGDGWLDVLGSGALKKKTLREGKGEDTKPQPAQRVTIQLEERLEDGTVVVEKREVSFTINEGEILPAVDMTVCLMCLDEVALVESDARFAYGEPGVPPKIPPNSRMLFEIELTKVEPPEAAFNQTVEEFVAKLEKRRVEGNTIFKQGNYERAMIVYQKILKRLESVNLTQGYSDEQEKELVQPLKISSLNNFAAACLHVGMYKEAVETCDKVLALDSDNSKAHFRKAKVCVMMPNVIGCYWSMGWLCD